MKSDHRMKRFVKAAVLGLALAFMGACSTTATAPNDETTLPPGVVPLEAAVVLRFRPVEQFSYDWRSDVGIGNGQTRFIAGYEMQGSAKAQGDLLLWTYKLYNLGHDGKLRELGEVQALTDAWGKVTQVTILSSRLPKVQSSERPGFYDYLDAKQFTFPLCCLPREPINVGSRVVLYDASPPPGPIKVVSDDRRFVAAGVQMKDGRRYLVLRSEGGLTLSGDDSLIHATQAGYVLIDTENGLPRSEITAISFTADGQPMRLVHRRELHYKTASPPVDSPSAATTISVAVVGPMTEQYAAFGEQLKMGAEQAVADLNADEGLLGRQLALEIGDDRCDPDRAKKVAHELISRQVAFVVGHFCSSSSIPAADLYDKAGIIMISPASSNPRLTQLGYRYVFRTVPPDDRQGSFIAEYIAQELPGRRVALADDGSNYGSGIVDRVRDKLQSQGIAVVYTGRVYQGQTEFSELVEGLRSSGADILVFGGYVQEAARALRQIRQQGLAVRLIGGDAVVDKEFWSIAGRTGEGALMSFLDDLSYHPVPEARDLVRRYRDKGQNPEGYTLYSYAAVQVWAQAVRSVGSTQADAVSAALRAGPFDTVIGTLGFDENGDPTLLRYVIYEWQHGVYVPVWPKAPEG